MSPVPLAGKLGIIFAALLVSIGLVIGAFLLFVYGLSDPGPWPEQKYPVVSGVRIDGDQLSFSTGRICPAGTELFLNIQALPKGTPKVFQIVASEPTSFIQVKNPLSPQDTWGYTFSSQIPDEKTWGAGDIDLSGLAEKSAEYPSDTFYFGEFGWLTAEEVAARDGKDLLTICTPLDE